MLVYVNQFRLLGENSCDEAFRLISRWLSKNVGQHISPTFLKSGKEKELNSCHIRTYIADRLTPQLYSILFTHPDKNISSRQWVTEIAVKFENKNTLISILLEVSDVSTRVKEFPKTTKPNLVASLNKSELLDPETIGLKAKEIKNNLEDFKVLKCEINKDERNYPIVLVSKRKYTDEFILEPNKLQEQLFGLAQVFFFDKEVDSYKLEGVIGKNCVWDGAVRIIYPVKMKSRLFRSAELTQLKKSSDNIYHEFLSFITHILNGYNKRNHLKPTDIRAKRNRDRISLLRKENQDKAGYEKLANEIYDELERRVDEFKKEREDLEEKIQELELSRLDLEEKIKSLEKDNYNLKNRIEYSLRSKENKKESGVIKGGEEFDVYDEEIKDLLLNIIESYFTSREDAFDKNDREYKILCDIIKSNCKKNYATHIFNECKDIFNNYSSVSEKMKNDLSKIGLEIVNAGKHNKLRFIGDERFSVTFAKTTSDKRAGENIVNHIKKALLHPFV